MFAQALAFVSTGCLHVAHFLNDQAKTCFATSLHTVFYKLNGGNLLSNGGEQGK